MKRAAVLVVAVLAARDRFSFSAQPLGASYNVYVCGAGARPHHRSFRRRAGNTALLVRLRGRWQRRESCLAKQWRQVRYPSGQGASWTATAPPDLSITHIYTVND